MTQPEFTAAAVALIALAVALYAVCRARRRTAELEQEQVTAAAETEAAIADACVQVAAHGARELERTARRIANAAFPCPSLTAFVHGELSDDQATALKAHLAGCEQCRRELVAEVELDARLSALPPEPTP